MLSEAQILDLLRPFGIELPERAISQLSAYLGLLMRWNEKINLTAIRTPEECVTRHFAESIFLARHEQLNGQLLDIGSGAGFPGLALKVAVPELAVTLLEPVAKKRAFLKEVVRCCGFLQVEVRPERLRRLRDIGEITQYNAITARAVGSVEDLVAEASPLLKQSGRLYLWLSKEQAHDLEKSPSCVEWLRMLDVPHSRERVILIGSLKGGCST